MYLGKNKVDIDGGEGLIQKAGVLAELEELGAVHVVHRRATAEGGELHKEPLQVLCNTNINIGIHTSTINFILAEWTVASGSAVPYNL